MVVTDVTRRATPSGPVATEKGPDAPAPFVAFVFAVVFGVCLPVAVTRWRAIDQDALNTVLAWIVCVYSAAALTALIYRGRGRVVRMAFFVFCYVFMGLAVIAQVSGGRYPIHLPGTGAYSTGTVRLSLLIVLVGIASYEMAGWLPGLLRRRRHAPDPSAAGATPTRRPLVVSEKRVILLGVVGLVFTAYVVSRTGIAPFFDSRQAAGNAILQNSGNSAVYTSTNKASRGVLKALSQAPVLIALFGMLYLRRHRLWHPSPNTARLGAVVLALLIVANIILNNPIANSRFWFGTVAITLVSIYLRLDRSAGLRWATIIAIVVLLFGFTSLQAFRRTGGAQNYSEGFQTDLVTSGTYSAFTMNMIGLNWLRSDDHTWGRQLAGSLLIFVPRAVWTNKPVDTGNLVLPYSNPAAALWTEGEVEAGLPGVVVYFAILGAGGAVLQRRFRAARPGELVHAIVPISAGLTIFVLRGSMLSVAGPAYFLAASIILIAGRGPRTPVTADRDPSSPGAAPHDARRIASPHLPRATASRPRLSSR